VFLKEVIIFSAIGSNTALCGWLKYSICILVITCFNRQHGQDTKEEVASRDLRTELESKEREAKEKRDGKTRSFTGQYIYSYMLYILHIRC